MPPTFKIAVPFKVTTSLLAVALVARLKLPVVVVVEPVAREKAFATVGEDMLTEAIVRVPFVILFVYVEPDAIVKACPKFIPPAPVPVKVGLAARVSVPVPIFIWFTLLFVIVALVKVTGGPVIPPELVISNIPPVFTVTAPVKVLSPVLLVE